MRKAKISLATCASQTKANEDAVRRLSSSGSLSGVSSSSSVLSLRLRPILSFSNVSSFWTSCGSLASVWSCFPPRAITTSSTRRANQEEKNMMKKTIYLSRPLAFCLENTNKSNEENKEEEMVAPESAGFRRLLFGQAASVFS